MTNHRPFTESELDTVEIVYLLTVTWAGRVFRFSTVPITLASSTLPGGDVRYGGGLNDQDYAVELDRLEVSSSGQSIPFEVIFPEVNVAQEKRAFRPLSMATGRLEMVLVKDGVPQQTYEQLFFMAAGRLVGCEWGLPSRPVGWATFTLQEEAWQDRTPVLAPAWRIDAHSQSAAPDDYKGKAYPLVFNQPGVSYDREGVGSTAFVTPAYKLSVGGGVATWVASVGPVAATQVDVIDSSGNTETLDVVHQTDGRGVLIATISHNSTSHTLDLLTEELWVVWNHGGGILNPDKPGKALKWAGDIIRWLMVRRMRIPVDEGAWVALEGFLNRIQLSFWVNDPAVETWAFLRSEVLRLFPISVWRGPRGLAPILHYPLRPTSQLPQISTGPGFTLVSPERDRRNVDEVINDIAFEYSWDNREQRWMAAGRLGPWEAQRDGETEDQYAQRSRNTYGHRPGAALQSGIVWRWADGVRVSRWRLRDTGFIPSWIVVHAEPTYGWLTIGREIALLSDDLSITKARRAQVVGRGWRGDRRRWELIIDIDDEGQSG